MGVTAGQPCLEVPREAGQRNPEGEGSVSRGWRSEVARPAGSGVIEFGSSWSSRRFRQAVGRSEGLQSCLQPAAGRGRVGWRAGGRAGPCGFSMTQVIVPEQGKNTPQKQ